MRVQLFAACLVAWLIAFAVFPVVVATLAKFARVQVAKIVFGFGPTLFATRFDDTKLEIRLVPFTSWVRFVGQAGDDRDADPPLHSGRVTWHEATRFGRTMAFVIAPRATVFALAVTIIGPSRASHAVLSGVPQLLMGAFGPFSTARTILQRGADVVARQGVRTVIALALAKWVALTLVAFFGDLAAATESSDEEAKTYARPRAMMTLMTLALLGGWLVAWTAWFVQ